MANKEGDDDPDRGERDIGAARADELSARDDDIPEDVFATLASGVKVVDSVGNDDKDDDWDILVVVVAVKVGDPLIIFIRSARLLSPPVSSSSATSAVAGIGIGIGVGVGVGVGETDTDPSESSDGE